MNEIERTTLQGEIEFLKLLREGISAGAIIPRGMEEFPQYRKQFAEVYSDQLAKVIQRLEALVLLAPIAASPDSRRT